jgi:hypothetical protein
MKTWTHVQTFIDDRKLPYQVERYNIRGDTSREEYPGCV